jgi:hypothetical protein
MTIPLSKTEKKFFSGGKLIKKTFSTVYETSSLLNFLVLDVTKFQIFSSTQTEYIVTPAAQQYK